jgi:hypothetical protein|tara:strand:+ start:292 stop:597 length:306 start_codon:yes stop_codon:yes gene_type:complete
VRFWRWEAPSAHHDDNGTSHTAYINEAVFDSRRTGGELLVKARDNQRRIVTRYKEIWLCSKEEAESYGSQLEAMRAHYVAAQQDRSGQPFFLHGRFGGALE